jgi:hypothetical protein
MLFRHMGKCNCSSTILDPRTRCELSATRSGLFTFRERASGTYCEGDGVGHTAGLDVVEKRNISFLYWKLNTGVQPLASRHTD